ncbi:hypothetical protein BV25DRAFT_1820786 [Artomyces pyxidatus]|uniref:Uncharacterized protein n=1 Tax=Artomyces pyxidatus TaxID=48021 RepID=A0ACB8TE66_9AGAM|nr:hypothetical protein BV25DRAFT_1820786 [Artomyces pyxidatus]
MPQHSSARTPRFEIIVSHVSQRWRNLAVLSPSLWTNISFCDLGVFEMTRVYLERSRQHRLAIELDLTECKRRSAKKRGTLRFIYPDYHSIELLRALELVVRHIARWSSFTLVVLNPFLMDVALAYLANVPSAPILNDLTMAIRRPNFHTFPQLSKSVSALLPFSGHAPNLKSLSLESICFRWDSDFYKGLTVLRLDGLNKIETQPAVEVFQRVLRDCSRLETLVLSGTSPADATGFDLPVELPALRHLVLRDLDCRDAMAIIHRIVVPALRIFQLHLHDLREDHTTAEVLELLETLCAPYASPHASMLHSVEALQVDNVQWPDVHWTPHEEYTTHSLLKVLPSLRVLALSTAEDNGMLALFGGEPRTRTSRDPPEKGRRAPTYCPELRIIVIPFPHAEPTMALLRHREKLCLPLDKLVCGNTARLSDAEIEEIEGHVFLEMLPGYGTQGGPHALRPYLSLDLEHYLEESYTFTMYENGMVAGGEGPDGPDDALEEAEGGLDESLSTRA